MSYWAATRTQPRRERVAQFFLERAGFETYCPKVRERRIRKGKRVETLLPLFPSYMFLRVEL
jgi:transcriptional antiterminator RfaH